MKNTITRAAFLTLIALGLPACATSSSDPPNHVNDNLRPGEYSQIQATEGLQQYLYFGTAIVTAPTAQSPMQIEVPVRNSSDDVITVQYQVDFFDRENRLLNPQKSWRSETLAPKVDMRFHVVGIAPEAVSWNMVVRPNQ